MRITRRLETFCLKKVCETLNEEDFSRMDHYSMSTYGLFFLGNDILLNNKKNILEFGSGISTIYMARLIEKYNLDTRITTVEHNFGYLSNLKEVISQSNLDHFVSFIHAPLCTDVRMGDDNKWYDETILNECLNKSKKYDMIVIDGPPAYSKNIELSRYGAIPFAIDITSNDCSIFLHDAQRQGEQKIMAIWDREFKLKFHLYNDTSVCRIGKFRDTHPNFIMKINY